MCISESTKARNMVYTILEMADTGDLGKEKIWAKNFGQEVKIIN